MFTNRLYIFTNNARKTGLSSLVIYYQPFKSGASVEVYPNCRRLSTVCLSSTSC